MREPSIGDRIEYLLFRLALSMLSALPERWALAVGSFLGWGVGRVLRVRWQVVAENLARAFPERDPAWRKRVAIGCYRHVGREAVATFRFSRESAEAMVARTEFDGVEALEKALAGGGGALIVTGHLGNWELGGAALAARGLPLDAVAIRQRNPLFDRDLTANRNRLGVGVIPRSAAPRDVLRGLAEGRCLGLVADQNARAGGVFVDFFDVPASTARGPAVFALRTGAPLFLAVGIALPGSPHRYRLHVREVRSETGGELSEDVRRLTQAHTSRLEGWIRDHPEQYFWPHKRWKTRPPAPPAER